MLLFTTVEAIARRLVGRYDVGVGPTFGHTLVGNELIEQLAIQAEAAVIAVVRSLYQWPLVQPQPQLAELVELHVVCNLNPIAYELGRNEDAALVIHACDRVNQLMDELRIGKMVLPGENRLPQIVTGVSAGYTRVARYGEPAAVRWN